MHQIIKGCYAHSAILALAFRSATVAANMYWRGAFPPFGSDSDNSALTVTFKQRVIQKDTKKTLFTSFLRRYPGNEQFASECALVNIKWLDSNERGFFCKTDLVYSLSSLSPIPKTFSEKN